MYLNIEDKSWREKLTRYCVTR